MTEDTIQEAMDFFYTQAPSQKDEQDKFKYKDGDWTAKCGHERERRYINQDYDAQHKGEAIFFPGITLTSEVSLQIFYLLL